MFINLDVSAAISDAANCVTMDIVSSSNEYSPMKFQIAGLICAALAAGQHRLTEINTREILVMAPLMALILVIGIWPAWILNVINKAVMMLF